MTEPEKQNHRSSGSSAQASASLLVKNPEVLKKPAVYTALALIACALWGTAFPCIKLGYQWGEISGTASQILFAGCRFTLAGLMTWLIGSVLEKKLLRLRKGSLRPIAVYGLLQTTLNYILFYIGLASVTGSKGSIINGTSAIFSILIAWMLPPHEKMNLQKITGCILGFLGILVINLSGLTGNGDPELLGTTLMIACAVVSGLSNVILKRIGNVGNPFQITSGQLMIGGGILLILGLVMGGRIGAWPTRFVWLLLYMSFLTAASFSIWTLIMNHNPVGKISIFMFSIPVFGVVFSALFLGENVWTLENMISLVLICLGIFLVNRSDPQKTGKAKETGNPEDIT